MLTIVAIPCSYLANNAVAATDVFVIESGESGVLSGQTRALGPTCFDLKSDIEPALVCAESH